MSLVDDTALAWGYRRPRFTPRILSAGSMRLMLDEVKRVPQEGEQEKNRRGSSGDPEIGCCIDEKLNLRASLLPQDDRRLSCSPWPVDRASRLSALHPRFLPRGARHTLRCRVVTLTAVTAFVSFQLVSLHSCPSSYPPSG